MARRLRLILLAGAIGVAATGCGSSSGPGAVPTARTGAVGGAPTPDRVVEGIRGQLAAALSARNLILTDARVPFRPAEPAELTAVGRAVFQVQLRDDPNGGFIVVYQLSGPDTAAGAASALATYLSGGPGRVQYPAGTIHVLRRTESTLIYYHWLPGAAIDPNTPQVQAALETVGFGVPVPG